MDVTAAMGCVGGFGAGTSMAGHCRENEAEVRNGTLEDT